MATFDNIHYNTEKADSYDKDINIVQSCRSSGKTTKIEKKIDTAYFKYGAPSLVLRRQVVDITESYIDDYLKVVNKFKPEGKKLQFYYNKGSMKEGVVDIFLSEEERKNRKNPYIRIIGLSAKMQKLKGGVLTNCCYLLFDEFAIDVRNKEKYLPDEIMRFKELYTTYRREALNGRLKCWFLGNAYSLYSPYHNWLNIDVSKIEMGKIIVGSRYTYELFKPCPELIAQLKQNPLFDIDDRYEKYALYGIPINDEYIQLEPVMPRNFSLFSVFKIGDTLLGVYANNGNESKDFSLWCQELKEWKEDYRRKAMSFNISDMVNYTFIPSKQIVSMLYPIRRAMNNRDIYYKDIGASYILEMVYDCLPQF